MEHPVLKSRPSPLVLLGGLAVALSAACQDPAHEPEPSLEQRDGISVMHLRGTPYEMGFQHGTFFREELIEGGEWIETSILDVLERTASYMGLLDEAEVASYPEVLEECQGLADAVDDDAFGLHRCLLLAYGDVVAEAVSHEMPGCTQLVVGPPASTGGLVHGRVLDWYDVPHIIDNPTLIVRHPDQGMASVVFGFPGSVSPYSGINEAGLVLASNEAYGIEPPDREGYAHTQMQYILLRDASTVAEVRDFFEAADHASTETVVASDATGDAAAFEMASEGMGERSLGTEGFFYVTNHFVHPDTVAFHTVPEPGTSSPPRWERLEQLVDPDGVDSLYGTFDLEGVLSVLRDTYNPETDTTHPTDLVDGGNTIANNGALHAIIFAPEQGAIWVAAGGTPIPQNPFVGFDVQALIDGDLDATPSPAVLE